MANTSDTEALATVPGTAGRVVTLRVVYLARLREALGCASEAFALRAGARPTVADLVTALRARGGVFAHELGAGKAVRYAVNQRVAHADTALAEGDEVAVFPPVTGG